jgi:RHS repeat-associated protein
MRVGAGTGTEGVQFLLGDHLGSTSVTTDGSGGSVVRQGYTPWGVVRYQVGGTLSTAYRFTGQRESSSTGLQWFRSRWYDPNLNRWLQPDSYIPDPYNPLDYDRYNYVRNNSINFVDPSGNIPCIDYGEHGECVVDPIWYQENGLSQQAANLKYGWDMLRSTDGYWNNYGKLPFTYVDFLGLFSYWEVASLFDGRRNIDMLEASTRRLYMKANCNGICTANQVFTFLANNGKGHQTSRVDGMLANGELVSPSIRGGTISTMMDEARMWGVKMIGAIGGSAWSITNNDRPSDWGNPGSPTYNTVAFAINVAGGTSSDKTAANGIYYWVGNFMILTANQAGYWTNYCSRNQCPPR